MKLQSAAAMSLESAGRMFLKAGENLILAADGDVELRNGFISAGGGEYRFHTDGIYYNGTKIVSTT